MKILIIGLPLFTERLVNQLRASGDGNQYLRFDTYYNQLDKLKFWFYLNSADLVYSINGAIFGSRAFEMTLNKGRKLVMHWVGTDVIHSRKNFSEGRVNKAFIEKATHFCEVEWIQKELKEMGIEASIVNFFSFTEDVKVTSLPDKFSVLTYIAKNREGFYGIRDVYAMAKALPEITVNIAGTDGYGELTKPDNVNLLGWVDDMDKKMQQAVVCLRLAEHDGLSGFVLEALSRGRHVVYRFNYPNCLQVRNDEELQQQIAKLKQKFDQGGLLPNAEGAAFIEQNFNREFILSNLTKEFGKASGHE